VYCSDHRNRVFLLFLLGTVLVFSWGGISVAADAGPVSAGFHPRTCWFMVPPQRQVRCGEMVVPERYEHPQGRLIAFPVAIFRATAGDRRDDPVILLGAGGPGEAMRLDNDAEVGYYWEFYDWILKSGRDLIVMDPRGVGLARPALTCPEVLATVPRIWGEVLTLEQELALLAEYYGYCRERLVASGVDVGAYNTLNNARDVEALRKALQIDRWNLYGTSYAASLAMAVIREFPEGVRSAILDSVQPPDVRFFDHYPDNVYGAFRKLFSLCQADKACRRDYPHLLQDLLSVVKRLNREPVRLVVAYPTTLEPFTVMLTGDAVISVLRQAFYDETQWGRLPMVISGAAKGSYELLAPFVRDALRFELDPDYSDGAHFSTNCREEVPFNDFPAQYKEAARTPIVRGYVESVMRYYEVICEVWAVEPSPPRELAPVKSTVPVLILAGELDPVTLAAWTEKTTEHFQTAFRHLFPRRSHDVIASSYCATIAAMRFLDEPTKNPFDHECLKEIPKLSFRQLTRSVGGAAMTRSHRGGIQRGD